MIPRQVLHPVAPPLSLVVAHLAAVHPPQLRRQMMRRKVDRVEIAIENSLVVTKEG